MLFTAIEIQSSLRGCMIEIQSSLRGCMIEYRVV
jgi:hypothetical protein